MAELIDIIVFEKSIQMLINEVRHGNIYICREVQAEDFEVPSGNFALDFEICLCQMPAYHLRYIFELRHYKLIKPSSGSITRIIRCGVLGKQAFKFRRVYNIRGNERGIIITLFRWCIVFKQHTLLSTKTKNSRIHVWVQAR